MRHVWPGPHKAQSTLEHCCEGKDAKATPTNVWLILNANLDMAAAGVGNVLEPLTRPKTY